MKVKKKCIFIFTNFLIKYVLTFHNNRINVLYFMHIFCSLTQFLQNLHIFTTAQNICQVYGEKHIYSHCSSWFSVSTGKLSLYKNHTDEKPPNKILGFIFVSEPPPQQEEHIMTAVNAISYQILLHVFNEEAQTRLKFMRNSSKSWSFVNLNTHFILLFINQ